MPHRRRIMPFEFETRRVSLPACLIASNALDTRTEMSCCTSFGSAVTSESASKRFKIFTLFVSILFLWSERTLSVNAESSMTCRGPRDL
jgi:hypothetical protein